MLVSPTSTLEAFGACPIDSSCTDYSPPHVAPGQTHKSPYSTLKEQKAFEKGLLEKTVKTK